MGHALGLFATSLALMLAQVGTQAPQVSLQLVGQIGGVPTALAVSGNIAYLAQGPRLFVLDVANPAAPRQIWHSEPHYPTFNNLALDGHFLYFTTGTEVGILDVADPARPIEISTYALHATSVAATGRYLVVTGGPGTVENTAYNGALHVLDISDPRHPVEVGANAAPQQIGGSVLVPGPWVGPAGGDGAVVIADARAYLGGIESGAPRSDGLVRVVDLSDQRAPKQIGGMTFPSDTGVPLASVTKERVFFLSTGSGWAGGHAWLAAFDRVTGHLLGPPADLPPTRGMAVDGSLAYLSTEEAADRRALQVFNVRDPTHPAPLSSTPIASAGHVVLAGPRLFVMTPTGFRIYDRTDPVHPVEVGRYEAFSTAGSLVIANGVGFALEAAESSSASANLVVFDLTRPDDPRPLARLNLPYAYGGVPGSRTTALTGSVLLVPYASSASDTGLYVVHVADSGRPRQIGKFAIGAAIWATAAQGETAYVVAGDAQNSVHVVDITDPRSAIEVGAFDVGRARTIVVDGYYAYLAGEGGELNEPVLQVYDVRDPTALQPIAAPTNFQLQTALGLSHTSNSLALAGNYLYAGGDSGLQILDISDPSQPREVGHFPEVVGANGPGRFGPVVVKNAVAYGLTDLDGVVALDVAGPAHPSVIASAVGGHSDLELVAGDDALYVIDTTGLRMYREPRTAR